MSWSVHMGWKEEFSRLKAKLRRKKFFEARDIDNTAGRLPDNQGKLVVSVFIAQGEVRSQDTLADF